MNLEQVNISNLKKWMNIGEFLPDCHDQNVLYFESSLMQMRVSIYSNLLEVDYYNKEICKKSHLTLSLEQLLDQLESKSILFICSGSLTRTYYQSILSVLPLKLRINVKTSSELEDQDKNYDYIVLAPQLDYELDQLEKDYGDTVISMRLNTCKYKMAI